MGALAAFTPLLWMCCTLRRERTDLLTLQPSSNSHP